MKSNSLIPWSLAALAAGFLALVWMSSPTSHEHEHHHEDDHEEHEEFVHLTPEQINAAGIEIAVAGPVILQEDIHAPATLELNSDRLAHVFPKVSGIAREAKKNLGEAVRAQELLALIDSKEAAEIKATYLAALKKTSYSRSLFEQEQSLRDKGLSTLQEYQTSLQNLSEAELTLEVARQGLYALGMTTKEIEQLPQADPATLRLYEVRAPISGNILHRHITSGEQLSTESELYTIADLNDLWVEISFYPHQLNDITKGQKVFIKDNSGQNAVAELVYVGTTIDEETRRIPAIAILDNRNKAWQVGNFVNASLTSPGVSVPLAIEAAAIQKIDGCPCAFIAAEGGFEIRPIQTGRSDGKFVEVTSGLQEGERYASNQSFLLKADHEKDEAEHMH